MNNKDFENLPQILSYIAWNLKRIAEEFERYNDREDKLQTPPKLEERNVPPNKLKDFLDNLGKDE
jgi:hypothetical protein